jgi:hypothetical protein
LETAYILTSSLFTKHDKEKEEEEEEEEEEESPKLVTIKCSCSFPVCPHSLCE